MTGDIPSPYTAFSRGTHQLSHNNNVIAILNTSIDLVEVLQEILEREGYNTVGALISDFKRGRRSLVDFMREHDPAVVIYDLPPPYEENISYLRDILNMKIMEDRQFIYTTTNKRALSEIEGFKEETVEIIGKPMDLNEVLKQVQKASEKRKTSPLKV